jgi:hypothetical protein
MRPAALAALAVALAACGGGDGADLPALASPVICPSTGECAPVDVDDEVDVAGARPAGAPVEGAGLRPGLRADEPP